MSDCKTLPNGKISANSSNWAQCRPWDITTQDRANTYIDALTQEALAIAGAQINVHKMLGVYEQTKLLDLTGSGSPLSGGSAQNYPASNAFSTHKNEWKSLQVGSAAILSSAFIGYDFGVEKLANGRQRYGVEANVRQHITTIKIKQSSNPAMRVLKARVERSDDGKSWYGVAVITLPNDDNLNTISFKQSVPNRYWRIRPLSFTGGSCDSWGVQALEMHDYAETAVNNIQDTLWLENRDRDYQQVPVTLKGYYDLISSNTELLQIGMQIKDIYQIRINFNKCVDLLGRPVVVGDIVELPSETQFTPDLRPVKRYLEVTDITWDAGSYTPGWMPTMLLVTAQPAIASQETRDIFGDLASHIDSSGLFDNEDGNNPNYQDYSAITQNIVANARTQVPERGGEGSNVVRDFTPEDYAKAAAAGIDPNALARMDFNPTQLYVEDALPQNGAPYTEGPELPPVANAKDGDYHRLTYVGLASDVPARLYRFSSAKNRWLYLETDRRAQYDTQKAVLNEYVTSPYKQNERTIK